MKTCILCGKQFIPKQNAQRVCEDTHYRECKYCGSKFVITRPSASQQCCSKECTAALRKATMLSRHGVEYAMQSAVIREKSENTQLQKYGVKHAAQSEAVKAQTQQHFLDRFGVTTPFLMNDFQSKSQQTCLDKYGVKYTSQIPGRTEKMQATNLDRYGSLAPMGNSEIQDKFRADMLDKYGVPYYCMTEDCRSKQRHAISAINRLVMSKLESIGLTCEPEAITLDRFSYDIFVPELRTVIEVNPTDTHNTIKNPWADVGIPKDYHKIKTQLAVDSGYRCINIWSWDSIDKIVDMLQAKTTLYARKCMLKVIDKHVAEKFEMIYHLQSKVKGQTVCLGLFKSDELVQVMTFGKPRYNKNYEWELLRLCTSNKYIVVGGAEKLWKYFTEIYSPKSIISYCDLSKFKGDVYSRIGMVLDGVTDPNLIWSRGRNSITSNLLLQRGYDQLFGTNFGKGTSNEQLMLDHGWLPVYDCGQARYVWVAENCQK